MRKKDETLQASLLDCARGIVAQEGAEAVNIRRLAKEAGIATGTVYNYFASKEDVLLALTEAYWRETLAEMREAVRAETFSGQLREIFNFLRGRITGPAGGMMRSLRAVEETGRERMRSMQAVLREALVQRLRADARIRAGVWSETFTQARYADFILRNMLALLSAGEDSIRFFLEVVERTLYQ